MQHTVSGNNNNNANTIEVNTVTIFSRRSRPASEYSVRAGSSIRESGGVVISVTRIYIHPDYSGWDGDIAIMYLRSALTFSDSISPIQLPEDGQLFADGTDAVVIGWGHTYSEANWLPLQLKIVTVPIINYDACGWLLPMISSNMLCAGFPEGGKDACQV